MIQSQRHGRQGFSVHLGRVAALILLGCPVSCQVYQSKPLDPHASAAAFGKRRLDDPALREAMVASGHWKAGRIWPPSPWTLRDLQASALLRHPEIAVAKAKAATARAAITTADSRPNPSVAFAPEFGTDPGKSISPWVLGFTLDLPIETSNKRGERTAKASAQANAASLATADTAWNVCSGVRAALLDLESASRRLEVLEAQSDNDTALVEMISSRVKAGESPATELNVYQSQRGRNLLELADGRSRIDAARAKLADALGVPAVSLRSTPLSFGALDRFPQTPAESSLRKAALIRRSDILGALEDYAAADAELRLQIAKQTPDFNLNPGYTFDQGQSKWALGVGLTLPLDRNRGPIAEAAAKRDEAAATFERLQIGIRGELDQAQAAYRADRERLRNVERLLQSQSAQLDDAERLVKAGEGDSLSERAQRSLVLQAKLARIDALGQAQQSLGRLQDSSRISLDER